jgi:hypothetical protein
MFRSKVASEVVTMDEQFGFGVADYKGREIGCRVVFKKVQLVAEDDQRVAYYPMEAGVYWVMQTNATRGGEAFGRGFNTQWFKTDLELFRAFNRYHEGALKRAQKAAV